VVEVTAQGERFFLRLHRPWRPDLGSPRARLAALNNELAGRRTIVRIKYSPGAIAPAAYAGFCFTKRDFDLTLMMTQHSLCIL
jgi:hypothetical protein